MRYSVSDTAEHGRLHRRSLIVTAERRPSEKMARGNQVVQLLRVGGVGFRECDRRQWSLPRQHGFRFGSRVGAERVRLMPFPPALTIPDRNTLCAGAPQMDKARATSISPPHARESRAAFPRFSRSARRFGTLTFARASIRVLGCCEHTAACESASLLLHDNGELRLKPPMAAMRAHAVLPRGEGIIGRWPRAPSESWSRA